jgi:hypothetical protein
MKPEAIAEEIDRIMQTPEEHPNDEHGVCLQALLDSCRDEVERCQQAVYIAAAEAFEAPPDDPAARAKEARAFRDLAEARACLETFHKHLRQTYQKEAIRKITQEEILDVLKASKEVGVVFQRVRNALQSAIEAHNRLLEDAQIVAQNGPLLDPDPEKRWRARHNRAWHRIHEGYDYLQWSPEEGLHGMPPKCRCTLPFDKCDLCPPKGSSPASPE